LRQRFENNVILIFSISLCEEAAWPIAISRLQWQWLVCALPRRVNFDEIFNVNVPKIFTLAVDRLKTEIVHFIGAIVRPSANRGCVSCLFSAESHYAKYVTS